MVINPHHTSLICVNTSQAIVRFVEMGLDPGSFGRALLLRDRSQCMARAHAILRRNNGEGVDGMMAFVREIIPAGMFRDCDDIARWMDHSGLRGATESDILMLMMVNSSIWAERLRDRSAA